MKKLMKDHQVKMKHKINNIMLQIVLFHKIVFFLELIKKVKLFKQVN